MKKSVRIILFILTIAISMGVIVYQAIKPLSVSVEQVQKKQLKDSFRQESIIGSNQYYSVHVPYDGKIKTIATEGIYVNKGDIILVMDDTELQTQKKQLMAQINALKGQQRMSKKIITENQIEISKVFVEAGKAAYENAQKNLERLQSLYDSGAIAKVELEKAQETLEETSRNLTIRKAELKELYEL